MVLTEAQFDALLVAAQLESVPMERRRTGAVHLHDDKLLKAIAKTALIGVVSKRDKNWQDRVDYLSRLNIRSMCGDNASLQHYFYTALRQASILIEAVVPEVVPVHLLTGQVEGCHHVGFLLGRRVDASTAEIDLVCGIGAGASMIRAFTQECINDGYDYIALTSIPDESRYQRYMRNYGFEIAVPPSELSLVRPSSPDEADELYERPLEWAALNLDLTPVYVHSVRNGVTYYHVFKVRNGSMEYDGWRMSKRISTNKRITRSQATKRLRT